MVVKVHLPTKNKQLYMKPCTYICKVSFYITILGDLFYAIIVYTIIFSKYLLNNKVASIK